MTQAHQEQPSNNIVKEQPTKIITETHPTLPAPPGTTFSIQASDLTQALERLEKPIIAGESLTLQISESVQVSIPVTENLLAQLQRGENININISNQETTWPLQTFATEPDRPNQILYRDVRILAS